MKKAPVVSVRSVKTMLADRFGKAPRAVKRLDGGLVNHVFEADANGEQIILRLSDDPTKLQVFIKEQWAITKARSRGVPTPEVLEVGNFDTGLPYMISRKVFGRSGTGSRDKVPLLTELGRYAAIINSIPTTDFGHLFDWSPNTLSRHKTWEDYLHNGLKVDERCELLAKGGILNPLSLRKLRAQIREMRQWKFKPTLNHGDVRLKNVILDDKRKILAILDWEDCSSNMAPCWELSIALHDLTMDEKEMFLRGYGLSLPEYMKIAPAIKALNILNYAGAAGRALKDKDKDQLLSIQARLNGAMDLYSL